MEARPDLDVLDRPGGELVGGTAQRVHLGRERLAIAVERLLDPAVVDRRIAELVHGSFVSIDEILQAVRSVTAADVRALAAEIAARPRSLAVVGPFDEGRTFAGAGL